MHNLRIYADRAGKEAERYGWEYVPTIVSEFISAANAEDMYVKAAQEWAQSSPEIIKDPALGRYLDKPHPNPDGVGGGIDYAGSLLNIWNGKHLGIPNKPSPLASALVTAPIGALAGYAGGALGNYLTGGHMFTQPWKTALMGAALGMTPALLYSFANIAGGQNPLTGNILDAESIGNKTSGYLGGPDHLAIIPVDRVKDMLLHDPKVSPHVSPYVRIAGVGLIEGANNLPSKNMPMPIVTPMDIGRMAVGLGSGYASGLIVGNALSALFGISDRARNVLRESGAAAGLLNAVIPLAFGR